MQRGIEQPVQMTRSARLLHLLTIILLCVASCFSDSGEIQSTTQASKGIYQYKQITNIQRTVRAAVLDTTAQDGLLKSI